MCHKRNPMHELTREEKITRVVWSALMLETKPQSGGEKLSQKYLEREREIKRAKRSSNIQFYGITSRD